MQNPYSPPPQETTEEALDKNNQKIKFFEDELKTMQARTKDPTDVLFESSAVTTRMNELKTAIAGLKANKEQLEVQGLWPGIHVAADELGVDPKSLWERSGILWERGAEAAELAGMGEEQEQILESIAGGRYAGTMAGQPRPREEMALQTPSWLRSMQEHPSETIPFNGASRAITPSGQKWGRLSPSQRQQYYGYAEHAGQRPEDLMWQMDIQKPRPLTLGRRWAAF